VTAVDGFLTIVVPIELKVTRIRQPQSPTAADSRIAITIYINAVPLHKVPYSDY